MKKILGLLLFILIIGLTIPANAERQKPRFNFLFGTSAFNAELDGTQGAYISPMFGLELFYQTGEWDWGVTVKGYFLNEITIGFVPFAKLNLGKIYLKAGIGSNTPFQFQAGRAVFRKDFKENATRNELWVMPRQGGKFLNTAFACIGTSMNIGLKIEAGIEWRELTKEWRVDGTVRAQKSYDALGAVLKIVY